jgi:hypothetical protein
VREELFYCYFYTHISPYAFIDELIGEEAIEAGTLIDDRIGGRESIYRQVKDILEVALDLHPHIALKEYIITGHRMEGAGEAQIRISQTGIIRIDYVIPLKVYIEGLRLAVEMVNGLTLS